VYINLFLPTPFLMTYTMSSSFTIICWTLFIAICKAWNMHITFDVCDFTFPYINLQGLKDNILFVNHTYSHLVCNRDCRILKSIEMLNSFSLVQHICLNISLNSKEIQFWKTGMETKLELKLLPLMTPISWKVVYKPHANCFQWSCMPIDVDISLPHANYMS
jgi:hypothetical protein